MSGHGPSRADAVLIRQLEDEGLSVSPFQLERWRASGLLPRNRRRGLGRARGSVSEPDDSTLVTAAALARLSRPGRALTGGDVLSLFAQGEPLPEPLVRAAYTARLDRLERVLAADADTTDAGFQQRYDAADRVARRASHPDSRDLLEAHLGLPGHGASRDRLRAAIRAITMASAGEAETDAQGLAEAFDALGAVPGGGDLGALTASLRDDALAGHDVDGQAVHAMGLERFREALDRACYAELRRAAMAYMQAWAFQTLILIAGCGSIAAEQSGTSEDLPPSFRLVDRAVLGTLAQDPTFRTWGASLDPRWRNPRDTQVLGSLGLLLLPDSLKSVEAYRDGLRPLCDLICASAAAESMQGALREQKP